jgi:nitrogen fixation protein NifU and related proteins
MTRGYDDVLMDHIRHARNYRPMPDADQRIEALNALCGDRIAFGLKWRGDTVADASFQCECCGISMASSSTLTEHVIGRTRIEIVDLCTAFLDRFDRSSAAREESDRMSAAQQALLGAARRYPGRARCASLAWRALRDALADVALPPAHARP